MRLTSLGWSFLLFLLFASVPSLRAQAGGRGIPPVKDNVPAITQPDEMHERIAHEQAKKANLAREAALKTDTDKLLKLATELKESVEKSSENVLSLEVLKKAEEIEKLARSVKEKMRGAN